MTCHLPQTNRYSSAARRISAVQTPQSQFGQGVDCSFFPLEVVNARLGHEGGADPAPRVQTGCLPIVSADGFSAGMAHIEEHCSDDEAGSNIREKMIARDDFVIAVQRVRVQRVRSPESESLDDWEHETQSIAYHSKTVAAVAIIGREVVAGRRPSVGRIVAPRARGVKKLRRTQTALKQGVSTTSEPRISAA